MEGGDIEESVGWFATTSIRILSLCLLSSTLLSTMVSQVKYTSLIGCQCYIMHSGLAGIVSSLMSLSR